MKWQQLISSARWGKQNTQRSATEQRTEFQRDYDRLIFSSPFRRLQNKTQVFPLPGSVFVHNRLTHSLEVSSVGRSLGADVARLLIPRYTGEDVTALESISAIVSAACLAHDLGNPPFGHEGEAAIRSFFAEGEGLHLRDQLPLEVWNDITHFDGNANTFRLLTHQFHGRRPGGFVMTYSTLAAIAKYPFSSSLATHPKFGFFDAEREAFAHIFRALGIPEVKNNDNSEDKKEGNALQFARHPLVFLVEAADDICYEIMDIEDAHKLRILTTEETRQLLLQFFPEDEQTTIRNTYPEDTDTGEQIAYLRSCVINALERACVEVFVEHETEILAGTFHGSLISHLPAPLSTAYQRCTEVARTRIYRSKEVADIELSGYHIIYTLLSLMTAAVTAPDKIYSKLLLRHVSSQYEVHAPDLSTRIMAVLDYLSGMTDVYALDLFRKVRGMQLPAI